MSQFIHDVGGVWEFIKGVFYIFLILGTAVILVPIIRDCLVADTDDHRPLD